MLHDIEVTTPFLYLSSALEASCLGETLTFLQLWLMVFLTEHTEVGVLLTIGVPRTAILCALFVLPLDSSHARSFASISILTIGVWTFWAEGRVFEIWRDLAAKLTVWIDSWYSPGFCLTQKVYLNWILINLLMVDQDEKMSDLIQNSYQTSNHQSVACPSKRILQYTGQFAFSVWDSGFVIIQCMYHIWQCKQGLIDLGTLKQTNSFIAGPSVIFIACLKMINSERK